MERQFGKVPLEHGCEKVLNREFLFVNRAKRLFLCLKPGFLLEPRKNYLQELQGNLMQKPYLLGPTTWKVMQRNLWKDIANLRIKLLKQLPKVATPCMDDHQFKDEENESAGELSTVCSQIVLKSLYLAL